MFQRIIAVFSLCALLMVSTSASAGTGLKDAVDELRFALTVEWDQHDEGVKRAAISKFNSQLNDLRERGQLDSAELLELALFEIKDEKVAADVRHALGLHSANLLSPGEAHQMISSMMEKSYSQGASWNGNLGVQLLLAGVLVVGLLGLCIAITVNDWGECGSSD